MSERSIFLSALDIQDESTRKAYLDEACGGDTRLRTEIEALLRSHVEAGSFLGTPAVEQVESASPPTVMLGSNDDSADQVNPPRLGISAVDHDETAAAILSLLLPTERPGSLGRLAHYEVLEVLGKGAFGVVLKAFDEKLHRLVAIKAMNPEMAATSPPRKRFLREARSSAAVKDEHIVSIYAVEEQPIPYLVMEYVAGQSLQQFLDEHGPLDFMDVLRIGQQLAAGLAAAHEKGLIHRDIKPANILLETGLETRAKITDFGLARATDDASLTQSGLIAGTPMFMAPEQAKGQSLDHRADLFSLGSVLYTMVSGRPPFRAPNTMAVLKRVCEDTPRPIRELIPETPGWLCDIIAKLQAKEPEERFQSAQDVAELLGQHLAHLQSPHAVPQPAPVLRSTSLEESPVPSREAVLARLRGPARGLIATACLNWIGLIALVPLTFYFVSQVSRGQYAFGPAEFLAVPILALATTVILLGGLKMLRGESYGWCVAASVMAILIGPGYLLGWPMGIWSLFVLSQPEVRNTFGGNAARRDAIWTSARSVATFGWTCLIFLLISAGAVWWGAELTGIAPRLMHGILAAGAFVVLLSSSIAESFASRRQAKDAARIFAGIAGAAALIGAGNGVMIRLQAERTGTLIVQSDEPFVSVTVGDRLMPLPGRDALELAMPVGMHSVVFFKDGQRVAEQTVRVARGENVVARWPEGSSTVIDGGTDSSASWQRLFNGVDLTGWKTHPDQPGRWRVENGLLVGSGGVSHLFHVSDHLVDFEFRGEVRLNDNGNSGVFVRTPFELTKRGQGLNWPQGYEVELVAGNQPNSGKEPLSGSLIPLASLSPGANIIQPRQWFKFRVKADGDHFDVWIDNVHTVSVDGPSMPAPGGRIALQVGTPGTRVEFRNLEVRSLKDSPLSISGLATSTESQLVDLATSGTFINPQQDCALKRQQDSVRISIPGNQSHDLELGKDISAPRLVAQVSGDFKISVQILPFGPPPAGSGFIRELAYRSAGIVLWQDDQQFLRYERATWAEYESGTPYVHAQLYGDNQRLVDETEVNLNPVAPTFLQLERKGSLLFLRRSVDGIVWTDWRTLNGTRFGDVVTVGVAGVNTCRDAAELEFRTRGIEGTSITYPIPNGDQFAPRPENLATWGTFVDPLRDCQLRRSANDVTVIVPGSRSHTMMPGLNLDAPRLVNDLDGDFLVQVALDQYPSASRGSGWRDEISYRAAGLLVWQDEQTFLRFEQARWAEQNSGEPYFDGQVFHNNAVLAHDVENTPNALRGTHLQVERSGSDFVLRTSPDGKSWRHWRTFRDVPFGPRVKVGLVAVNPTKEDLEVHFRDLAIRQSSVARPLSVPVAQPGWTPLFNGRDLTGWKVHPSEPGQWRVENGILIGSGTPSCLFSERGDFTDFELHCEVSISQNGDGGVLVRTPFELPEKDGLPGYEAQIQSGRVLAAGWTTGAIGQSDPGTGWRMKQAAATSVTHDAFFPLVVKAVGNHLETYVNGLKVAEYDDPYRKYLHGHIALQQSGPNTTIKFRKIEIRELAMSPAASLKTVEAPWLDLLQTAEVRKFAATAKGVKLQDGTLFLSSPGDGQTSQLWIDSIKLRRGRMRLKVQAAEQKPQGVIGLGWDHGGGSPRRLDAILCTPDAGKPVASLWQYGPTFEVTALLDRRVDVDWTQPITIEIEIRDAAAAAKIAGIEVFAARGLDPERLVFPFVGAVNASWKVLEWQVQDLEPAGSPVPDEPWIDLLQSAELNRAAASGLRRQAGALILDSKGESRAAQTAIESLKVKHARMRLTAQAVDSQPQEMLALGWTHGEGTPRRLDAVLQSFGGDRSYAHLWQFGPQFELTNLVKSPAITVDWSAPIVIECEIHDGTVTASIAGAPLQAVGGLDPMRPVMPYIGGTGSWRILEWKLQDLTPQVAIVPVDFNGAWDSGWGVVTFKHAPPTGDQPFELEGEYTFHGKGVIQGTVDPLTRTFKGRFQESATQGGRLLLTLSPDGNSITGWYDYQNEPFDVSQPQLSWNMTRRPNPLDFSGDWDSRWGVVTLTHPAVNDLLPVTMTGKYYSGKGRIEGTADPRTRTFAGAFREATGMSGRINLQLTADGQHILGRYEYSNTPGTVYEWDMTRSGAPASALFLENLR